MTVLNTKYKIIPPKEVLPTYVANVHRSGKIGFTVASGKHFGLDTTKSVALMVNGQDTNDENIYGIFLSNGQKDQGYRITKNGEYYSVEAKEFFEQIGVDYSKPISFSVSDFVETDGTKMLKFTKRQPKTAANG